MLSLFSSGAFAQKTESAEIFRLHLVSEPTTLSPYSQKLSQPGYFFSQIYGTLLSYKNTQLTGNLAENCKYSTPTEIQCKLRSSSKWSDGEKITAKHFINAFQNFISPEHKSFRADLLFPIKNAEKIYNSQASVQELGVRNKGDTLIFELEKPDSSFIYTLTSPLFAPVKDKQQYPPVLNSAGLVGSGVYTIEYWKKSDRIRLTPNRHFWKYSKLLPKIDFFFINEDSVALGLYLKNELDFLRRLPTLHIPAWTNKADFHAIPQYRFDYIGIGENVTRTANLAEAITQALDYDEMQRLFYAKPRPGCSGILPHMLTEKHCLNYSPAEAKQRISQAKLPQLSFLHSKQGGSDHERLSEWLQSQLKKNLSLPLQLVTRDNKVFLSNLSSGKFDLFRKGITPEHPTCLAALENFKKGHPENYLKIDLPEFENTLNELQSAQGEKQKQLCSKALAILMQSHRVIPTGPIYFSILAKPQWSGWNLNELNSLDLSELRKK